MKRSGLRRAYFSDFHHKKIGSSTFFSQDTRSLVFCAEEIQREAIMCKPSHEFLDEARKMLRE